MAVVSWAQPGPGWEPASWSPQPPAEQPGRPAINPPALTGEEPVTAANLSRGIAQELEAALRKGEHVLPWFFHPRLPLAEIADGMPKWDGAWRSDTGESAAEFRQITDDYKRELERSTVFPPLLVREVRPAADRKAMRWSWWWWVLTEPQARPVTSGDYYFVLANGRHRALAAWELGLRTFPAFAWCSAADIWPLLVAACRKAGPSPAVVRALQARCLSLEAEVLRVAGERGRRGERFTVDGTPVTSHLSAPVSP